MFVKAADKSGLIARVLFVIALSIIKINYCLVVNLAVTVSIGMFAVQKQLDSTRLNFVFIPIILLVKILRLLMT